MNTKTTYEEFQVYCPETDSYETRKRPVFSEAEISSQNLGQGTSTNASVRETVNQENKGSEYRNEAGHIVPKAAGGSGTNRDNIFIQDFSFNRKDNKEFDNHYMSDLRTHPNAKVSMKTWFEYDNNYSTTKPRWVTKQYELNFPNPDGSYSQKGSYRETYNNYNDESKGKGSKSK